MANDELPRLYSTTPASRRAMPIAELEALWTEYRAYWAGHEGHSNRTQNSDYQKDWKEDKEGTYR